MPISLDDLSHPELIVALALLACGVVTVLAARNGRGAVAGGTLLLAAIIAATFGSGSQGVSLLAATASCMAAGGLLLLGRTDREEEQ